LSGFGEALVKDALQRRYKVIATARRLNSIHHLKKLGAHCLELDVTSESINETAQVAVSIYGRVDYLINNAGIAIMGNLEEFNYADIRKIYETFVRL
jgi:NADP-dependent 3-hydroxy acid dehydrogenase YdfG